MSKAMMVALKQDEDRLCNWFISQVIPKFTYKVENSGWGSQKAAAEMRRVENWTALQRSLVWYEKDRERIREKGSVVPNSYLK